MQMIRVCCKTDYDPITAMRGYCDAKTRLDYDINIKDCGIEKSIGCNLYVAKQITISIGLVSSRDIYHNLWVDVRKDGVVKVIVHEIDWPETKGKVRMRLPMGGVMCVPDPDAPGKSIMYFVMEADLQGKIPEWVWTLTIKQLAYGMVSLRKMMPKYLKKNPDIMEIPPVC